MPETEYQTSEKISVNFSLATPIQRIAAYFIDYIIKIATVLVMLGILGIASINEDFFTSIFTENGSVIILAVYLLLGMIFFLFYNMLFEIFWKGQTPGKKIVHIRVIMDDGTFVSVYGVILRNIFRIVDMLPLYYITGIICLFVNKRVKRVGDMIAGTIVISEERVVIPLVERTVSLEPLESFSDLGEIIGENIKRAIIKYIKNYGSLSVSAKLEIEKKLVAVIVKKSGIEKPEHLQEKDYIVAVYNKLFE